MDPFQEAPSLEHNIDSVAGSISSPGHLVRRASTHLTRWPFLTYQLSAEAVKFSCLSFYGPFIADNKWKYIWAIFSFPLFLFISYTHTSFLFIFLLTSFNHVHVFVICWFPFIFALIPFIRIHFSARLLYSFSCSW